MMPHSLLTPPNFVTLLRPLCTPLFVWYCTWAITTSAPWATWGSILLFIIVLGSDMMDGWLARRLGQTSVLGRTLDHVCDVGFILTAMGGFVMHGLMPWWLPASIAWAFGLYALDSRWRTHGWARRPLLASRLGHYVGMLAYVVVGAVTSTLVPSGPAIPSVVLQGSFYTVALMAFASGTERLWLLLRAQVVRRRLHVPC